VKARFAPFIENQPPRHKRLSVGADFQWIDKAQNPPWKPESFSDTEDARSPCDVTRRTASQRRRSDDQQPL